MSGWTVRPGMLVLRLVLAVFAGVLAGCDGPPPPQGFAGLAEGAQDAGYRQPGRGERIELPGDWGAHPGHRIEWWYLTANLETASGDPMGLQWTQFRQGLEPRASDTAPPDASLWPLQSAWMAHGAVSFQGKHWFSERFARGDIGQAGAHATPLQVWLDHWQLKAVTPERWQLNASGDGWSYRLELTPGDRVIRHGEDGFSEKTEGGYGSMYFSLIDIGITGTVRVEGADYRVSGTGWLDREWSSQFLRSDQQGWDWFALRLESGERLMVFQVGRGEGAFRSGTWIDAQGSVHNLAKASFTLKPLGYRDTQRGEVPVRWRIELPDRAVNLVVQAPEGSYWNTGLYPYWESPVSVSGTAAGEGYMELTGYGQR